MSLEIDLELCERRDDRVLVDLRLRPTAGDLAVDGATVQLVGPDGEALCPRMILPIAGQLRGPVGFSVELRAAGAMPEGTTVLAVAWVDGEAIQGCVPADPYTRLHDHMCGTPSDRSVGEVDGVVFGPMDPADRAALELRLPWVAEPVRRPTVAGVLDAEEPEPSIHDFADELGLDDENAAWLHDLLDEA